MPTPKEHWEYTLNEWRKEPFTRITNALPEIKIFYDIGANVGGVTETLKRKYPNMEAYCFEPVGVNYEELVKNVPYATHIKKGVYYGERRSKLLWRGSNEGGIFLEFPNSGEPRIDTLEWADLVTLEELDMPRPDLIKMDVEGSELNIIEHSQIVKECPNVIIEWHPDEDAVVFLEKHMPKHRVVVNIHNSQLYLQLK